MNMLDCRFPLARIPACLPGLVIVALGLIAGCSGRTSVDTTPDAASDATPDAPPSVREAEADQAIAVIGGRRFHPFYAQVISPHVVRTDDYIYTAFQRFGGQPVVMRYDRNRQRWDGPVLASQRSIDHDIYDSHGNPAMYIDQQGRVQLFFGSHGRVGNRRVRMARPHDLASWQPLADAGERATYPQVFATADGRVRLFYRAGGHPDPWVMQVSEDDGQTFGEATKVIEMRLDPSHRWAAAYVHFTPSHDGKTVHAIWNYKEDDRSKWPEQWNDLTEAVYRFNAYHIQMGEDGVWRNAAGEAVKLPVSKREADAKCRVFDSGDVFAYPRNFVSDPTGDYFHIVTRVSDWSTGVTLVPTEHRYAHLPPDAGAWQLHDQMPRAWPKRVRTLLRSGGAQAYQRIASGAVVPLNDPLMLLRARHEPKPTAVFLWHEDHGWLDRAGGPAKTWQALPGPDGQTIAAGLAEPQRFFEDNRFLWSRRIYRDVAFAEPVGFTATIQLYNPLTFPIHVELRGVYEHARPKVSRITPRTMTLQPMSVGQGTIEVVFDPLVKARPIVRLRAHVRSADEEHTLDLVTEDRVADVVQGRLLENWVDQRRRAAWGGERPVVEVPPVSPDTRIAIDGKLDEAAWQGEPVAREFVPASLVGHAPDPTRAWVRHDGQTLYVGFRCEVRGRDLAQPETPRDGKVFLDESVELFVGRIGHDAARTYAQVVVNTAGAVYDALGYDADADLPARVATHVADGVWSVEIALPLSAVPGPDAGDLRILLGRNHRLDADRIVPTQYPLTGAGNHAPQYFADLRLLARQPQQ